MKLRMRTKNFILVLIIVIFMSLVLIIFGPNYAQNNENLKNIVSQTHQHLKELKVSFFQITQVIFWVESLRANVSEFWKNFNQKI